MLIILVDKEDNSLIVQHITSLFNQAFGLDNFDMLKGINEPIAPLQMGHV